MICPTAIQCTTYGSKGPTLNGPHTHTHTHTQRSLSFKHLKCVQNILGFICEPYGNSCRGSGSLFLYQLMFDECQTHLIGKPFRSGCSFAFSKTKTKKQLVAYLWWTEDFLNREIKACLREFTVPFVERERRAALSVRIKKSIRCHAFILLDMCNVWLNIYSNKTLKRCQNCIKIDAQNMNLLWEKDKIQHQLMFSALLKDSDNLLVQCRPALPAELQRPATRHAITSRQK